MESKLFLLTALCVLTASWSQSQAAALPAPWQFSQEHNLGQPSALAFSEGQLFAGGARLSSSDLPAGAPQDCYGSVRIFETDAASGTLQLSQVLSRLDAGLDCDRRDLFGRSIAVSGDLLVVAAPGYESLLTPMEPAEPGGEILIYRRDPTSRGLSPWQFHQRISGEEVGSLHFGWGIATDGTRVYAFNRVDAVTPASFGGLLHISRPESVISFIADEAGLFHEDSRVERPPLSQSFSDLTRFSVFGDQLLLDSGVAVDYLVRDDASERWQVSQRIGDSDDFIVRASGAQISGEHLVVGGVQINQENGNQNALRIYRRSSDGLSWQTSQTIPHPIAVVPPFTMATGQRATWALRGADLVVAWPINVSAVSEDHPLQTRWNVRHYRLNEAGQFAERQNVATFNARRAPQLLLEDESLNLVWQPYNDANESAALTFQQFFRNGTNNLAIDRGISGGWWFGPQRNGQGVGLEVVSGNRVQMAWVTHDQQGEQMWLFGVGQIDVDRVRIDLVQPVGGRFGADFDPATVQRQAWGQVELVFNSCHQGQLNYRSPLMGEGSLPLLRLTAVDGLTCGDATATPLGQRWNGSWFDPSHNGEGVMMHVTPTRNGPRLSTLWMTYHPDGRQAVFYSAADLNDPGFAFFDSVIRPTGPSFLDGNLGGQLRTNPWGSFELVSPRCGQARLDYVSNDPGFGSGRLDLVRFATPLGNRCTQ